jgi:hypothetical protein
MASKICTKCKDEKTTAHFIAVNSLLHSGSLPICRECLAKMISSAPEKERWNVIDKICQWADVPFLPGEWEKLYQANGKDTLGVYIAIFRTEQYKTLDWMTYNNVYLQLLEEGRVEDAIPELREKRLQDWRRKWGMGYDEEQLEYLENLHLGLINSQNVVGALNEDQALKLCKISLIIEEKIRGGVDFTKDLKAYDELAKLSNLTPKNVKDANEFDSFGEVYAYLEKTGWQNKYYDGAVRDEVDNTEKNIKNWIRYLYINETGIAEEIEQRINNLKVAAELEGEEFDEIGFRDYLSSETQDIKEDFKIDI